ncbi:MAG: PLP-dependent aminotransferase family protein [Burkholderiales bacterium]
MGNPSESVPRYRLLAERLAKSIAAAAFRAGDRLPSVRELAAAEQVSIGTAVAAYRALEDRRLIQARPKSGFFVAPRRPTFPEPETHRKVRAVPEPVSVSRLIMEILEAARDPTVVPLAAASPSELHVMPSQKVARALASRLRREPGLATLYRMGPGHASLRRAIAQHAFGYGCLLEPDDVIVTNGCMEALTLALRALVKPGQAVAIESPTYFSVLQILESLGIQALEVPTNPRTGMSVDALEFMTRAPGTIAAVVVSANFSNPLGSLMPDGCKHRLAQLMQERGIPVIEDDVYGDVHFSERRPRPIKHWDRSGNVLLCSSFSKTLAPGLRVGWIAPGRFREAITMLKFTTSVTTSELVQAAAAELIGNGGFEHHLRKLRHLFRLQVEKTTRSIEQHFPTGCRITRPQGGFVLWIEMPERIDSLTLFWRALAAGVSIAPGVMFSATGTYRHHVRISCGNPFSDATNEALARLGAIARELAQH